MSLCFSLISGCCLRLIQADQIFCWMWLGSVYPSTHPESVSDFSDAALRATVCFGEISPSGHSQICSFSRTLSQGPLKLATVFEQGRKIH